jgi:hypothetical protein
MLEDAALYFADHTEIHSGAIFGINILGFIAALLASSSSKRGLHRAPYFLLFMLLLFASSIMNFAWLLSFDAMAAGYLWVLIGLIFAGVAVLGFAYGKIAHARSMAAFGHGGFAFLAYIPVACLYLLAKESKTVSPARCSATTACRFGSKFSICCASSWSTAQNLEPIT